MCLTETGDQDQEQKPGELRPGSSSRHGCLSSASVVLQICLENKNIASRAKVKGPARKLSPWVRLRSLCCNHRLSTLRSRKRRTWLNFVLCFISGVAKRDEERKNGSAAAGSSAHLGVCVPDSPCRLEVDWRLYYGRILACRHQRMFAVQRSVLLWHREGFMAGSAGGK